MQKSTYYDKLKFNRKKLFENIEKNLRLLKKQKITLLDLKIINASIEEMQKTAQVFAPYHHVRKVTVFGSARTHPKEAIYRQAKLFAKEIEKKGYMVMTGAGPGIMQAAHEGAGAMKSIGLNIKLPFEQLANPVIQGDAKLVNYKYFFNRKLTMIKESDALVLFPGGFGTQDEMFETLTLLQTGKTAPTPVVCIEKKGGRYWQEWKKFNLTLLYQCGLVSKEDLNWIYFTNDIDQAVNHVCRFYKNFHSIRYHKNFLLVRVWRIPPNNELQKLSLQFKEMIPSGSISIAKLELPYDPDISDLKLHTLSLQFNQKSFGVMRKLIDRLNDF